MAVWKMVMVGVVRTRHLLTHSAIIVREFGVRCWVRCMWRAVVAKRKVTFLECVECVGRL
jgi:hypothetical protein